MRKLQKIILGLMAPILISGPGLVTDADAGIKVKATFQTPNANVRVGYAPYGYHRSYMKRKPVRVSTYRHYTVTRQDWEVAGRLSLYTGVPAQDLIHYKREGYRWAEIGRWFYVPRPVVQAAMDQHSWKRFLREEGLLAGTRRDPHRDRRVACFEFDD